MKGRGQIILPEMILIPCNTLLSLHQIENFGVYLYLQDQNENQALNVVIEQKIGLKGDGKIENVFYLNFEF